MQFHNKTCIVISKAITTIKTNLGSALVCKNSIITYFCLVTSLLNLCYSNDCLFSKPEIYYFVLGKLSFIPVDQSVYQYILCLYKFSTLFLGVKLSIQLNRRHRLLKTSWNVFLTVCRLYSSDPYVKHCKLTTFLFNFH